MRVCWVCNGTGYVRNCDIEDGMMTGRDRCPGCEPDGGRGRVSEARVLAEIWRLANLPEIPQ